MNYSNADADVQYSAWMGVCYVTPLLGGYIADTYLGRYYTILVFISIYLVGLVLVVLGSIPGHVSPAVFFPAIYIVSLGTGGIKPNVSTLGADQFDERYAADRKEKESFFNW
jgi:peptide/histidine transporter 3/4